jgi:dTDP-4-dehydrorhamnose 3,5-epimerase
MLIPRGFAHGFVVLSQECTFAYKVDNYYSVECDRGIAFNDPALNIDWIVEASKLQLSAKDTAQPLFTDADHFTFGNNFYA